MRLSSRRSDDADVIRARLRALLDERTRGGWVPDDGDWPPDETALLDDEEEDEAPPDGPPLPGLGRHRAPDRVVRWDPGRPGARSLWIAGLVAALVLVAWTWLQRPVVEPAPDPAPADEGSAAAEAPSAPPVGEAAESSTTVVVSVVGLVVRPGLVTLPTGARVAEAIDAAGGLLPEADPASVNLAAVVADGQQIAVGVSGAAAVGAGVPSGGLATAGPVNLNTAGVAELDALPGIGPVLAQRIVDHRTREGPFTSVDQLDDVPGIGPSIAADLAGLVAL